MRDIAFSVEIVDGKFYLLIDTEHVQLGKLSHKIMMTDKLVKNLKAIIGWIEQNVV
jgi:hypothetical protein